MRIVFSPEARREAIRARRWYEDRARGLGLEFARALEASIEAVARSPGAYPIATGECRRILMRRFPFSIVFRARKDELLILAVFHHSRKPDLWRSRIDT